MKRLHLILSLTMATTAFSQSSDLGFFSSHGDVDGHPRDKDIMLRMMPAAGGEITTLAAFFGGQGTINVPSWSPDSQHISYVRYQPDSRP